MADPINSKIILNFGWQGPSGVNGGSSIVNVVDLVFKNATTEVSVHIPDQISPSTPRILPFTCRKYQETEAGLKMYTKETHPDSLKITVEQIRNLTLKAGFFSESPIKGDATISDREVALEVPEELEIGKCYTLLVTSDQLALSARLERKEKVKRKPTQEENRRAHFRQMYNQLAGSGETLQSLEKLSTEVLQARYDTATQVVRQTTKWFALVLGDELSLNLLTDIVSVAIEERAIVAKALENKRKQTSNPSI